MKPDVKQIHIPNHRGKTDAAQADQALVDWSRRGYRLTDQREGKDGIYMTFEQIEPAQHKTRLNRRVLYGLPVVLFGGLVMAILATEASLTQNVMATGSAIQTATSRLELSRDAGFAEINTQIATTAAPSATPEPSPTDPPESRTPTASVSQRPRVSVVPAATTSGLNLTPVTPVTYYASSSGVNVRNCPSRNCETIDSLGAAASAVIVGMIDGEAVNSGNRIWYVLENGGYVYSGVMQQVRPATSVPNAGGGNTTQAISTPTGQQAVSPFGCNGLDDLNCSDFRAIGQNANAHLAACGDEDRLDQDGDGRGCEN